LSYRIELETRARREFLALPGLIADRLVSALDDLRANPRPPGARKLTGQEGYRIRKDNYRILYTIDDRVRLVRVYRIGHRRDVYRR